jgi:glucose/arabinose dehydrogenase
MGCKRATRCQISSGTNKPEATLNKENMRYLVVSPDGKLLAGLTGDSYNHATQIKVLQRPDPVESSEALMGANLCFNRTL